MTVFNKRLPVDDAARCSATIIWLLFVVGIALSPLSDFLSIRAAQGGGEAFVSLLVRGGVVAGSIAALLLRGRIRQSNVYIAILATVSLTAAMFAYAQGEMTGAELGKQVIFIFKVFSFFVCHAALSKIGDRWLEMLEPLVIAVLITYAMAIIAGAGFSIDMFRSYQADTQIRSGYKGIVYAQNEASALLIVGLAYGYLRVIRFGWVSSHIVLIGSMLCASMLLGTKGAMVGAFGVICAYLYARHSVTKATVRALIVVAMLATMAISAYFVMPSIHQAVDLTFRYFSYHHDHADGNGLLTIFLSGRNVKFANVWHELSRQDYLSLWTGGYPVVRYQVEIDAPDLMLALGTPVFLLYMWAYGSRFIYRGKASVTRFGKLFFVVLMALACTAGHVLVSALTSPYLAIVAVLVDRSVKRATKLM